MFYKEYKTLILHIYLCNFACVTIVAHSFAMHSWMFIVHVKLLQKLFNIISLSIIVYIFRFYFICISSFYLFVVLGFSVVVTATLNLSRLRFSKVSIDGTKIHVYLLRWLERALFFVAAQAGGDERAFLLFFFWALFPLLCSPSFPSVCF